MRRVPLYLASLLLLALPCSAQPTGWHVQHGGCRFLYAVHSTSPDTCYAVGFYATALRTFNGGISWASMPLPKTIVPQKTLFIAVGFSSQTNGCMAFADTILHSTDAGSSWSYATMDQQGSVGRFVFPTPTIGYAAGGSNDDNYGKALLKTTDGGASWRHLPPPDDTSGVEYYGIDFRDRDHGMIITSYGEPPCYNLWRTNNGGTSWDNITTNVIEHCSRNLSAITHVGGTTWVIGGNSIERSSDDGQTWTKVGIFPLPTAISFADSLVGYATCSIKGRIYKTMDGGKHWSPQEVTADTIPKLIDVSAASSSHAYAIGQYYPTTGNDDVIVQTTDGGGITKVDDETTVLSANALQVFPNPAGTTATIYVAASNTAHFFSVVDYLGRVVYTNAIHPGETSCAISTSTLAPGLYWCVVGKDVSRFGVVR